MPARGRPWEFPLSHLDSGGATVSIPYGKEGFWIYYRMVAHLGDRLSLLSTANACFRANLAKIAWPDKGSIATLSKTSVHHSLTSFGPSHSGQLPKIFYPLLTSLPRFERQIMQSGPSHRQGLASLQTPTAQHRRHDTAGGLCGSFRVRTGRREWPSWLSGPRPTSCASLPRGFMYAWGGAATTHSLLHTFHLLSNGRPSFLKALGIFFSHANATDAGFSLISMSQVGVR
ncbi:hypothetical protein GQ53DRAFT_200560 [Thozetella sp. PMI_491]|nr:hypothetical protein GQ53DRAFT_200560 [Thozetella sp. PMI_491]